MNTVAVAGIAAASFLMAWFLTGRWRALALARGLIDVPNDRSSHVVATPRGGGIAIVVAVLTALPLLTLLGTVALTTTLAFWTAGLLVAVMGFIDDRGHVDERWRLIVHFSAAGLVLALVGGLPPLPVFGTTLSLGWAGHGLALFYLVWLLNLTNFMDGIDGQAATGAVAVSLAGAGVASVTAGSTALWPAPVALGAAAAGFLVWNWPPARIFMGDVGSGFLGVSMGILSLEAAAAAPQLFWSWTILLAVFVSDTTVTLLQRAVRRIPRFWGPHKTHGYHRATALLGSHRRVTVIGAVITLAWLTPLAGLVASGWLDGAAGAVLAYAPLVGLAFWLGAGVPDESRATAITRPTHNH